MKKNVKNYIAIGVMAVLCIAACLHWGFFGVIVSTIIYGIWANCTEEPSKK